jgi:hypothetical protein
VERWHRVVLIVALGVALAAPAAAQQVEIEAKKPEPERRFEIIPPGMVYEVTRPGEADYYPRGGRVEHDPAFIEPFTAPIETPTMTGRLGLSGWTSPNTPVGAEATGWREVTGWFGLGFSVTWNGPPPVKPVRR